MVRESSGAQAPRRELRRRPGMEVTAVDLANSSPARPLSATETAELRLWYGVRAARDVSCNQSVTLRYADIRSCTAT
jgi:hypothetical protein